MLEKPKSIEIEILTDIFTHVTNYFNVTTIQIKEKYKINIDNTDKIITTISKLRKLSKDLKIPVSTFFLSEIPKFPQHQPEFRNINLEKINFKTINAIRETLWFIEIYNTYNDDYEKNYLPVFDETMNPISAGQQISKLIEFNKLRKFKDIDKVLRSIRAKLNKFEILVFQSKFPMNDTRGFTLKLQNTNAITLNANEEKPARIFTLLHEIGHIVLNKHGISNPTDLNPENNTEIWCNKFAASIMFPDELLSKLRIDQNDIGPDINQIAQTLHSSKHALGIELVIRNKITKSQLKEFLERPYYPPAKKKSGGFTYKNKVYSEKGTYFTQILINAYNDRKISQIDVSEILGIRHKTFDSLLAAH